MAKTLWITSWLNGSPDLPPLRDPDGGLQLAFTNLGGEEKGGFCVLCPRRDKVALVLVFSSKATAIAMRALPAKYLFLGVVRADEEDPGITMPTRAAVVTFLQGHGIAMGSLPTTTEAIKRWLRNAVQATDEAIAAADMT